MPAYRGLRRAHPEAIITLAAPAALAPLIGLDSGIDRLLPVRALGGWVWPGRAPDLAVNLHGRGPQSVADLVRTRARRLVTHAHPQYPDFAGPAWRDDQPEVLRWCRLLRCAGIPGDATDLRLGRPAGPAPVAGAVVIHPGASAASRRWPVERFAEVARGLSADGERVVVTGSAGERPLAASLVEAAGLPADSLMAGDLDLSRLAALVSDARLVLCGDTGVAHLASAYGTPSVVMFGPTSPAHWGPPPSGPHRVLWRGGTGDPHGSTPDPGLLQIQVVDVLAACRLRLEARPVPSPVGG